MARKHMATPWQPPATVHNPSAVVGERHLYKTQNEKKALNPKTESSHVSFCRLK